MNDPLFEHNRRPIVVADSRLRAGTASTRVRGDEPEAVLRQYLRLIRRVRNQQRDRLIALRRADLSALADHLGWSDDEVLSQLADLMGSSRRQRTTMAAALAAGAGLITVAGSSAAAPPEPRAGSPPEYKYRDPIVVVADHLAPTTSVAKREHAARLLPPDGSVRRGDAPVAPAVARGNDVTPSPADGTPAGLGAAQPPGVAADDPPPATTADDPIDEPPQATTADDPIDEPPPATIAADPQARTGAHPAADDSDADPEPAANEVTTGDPATDEQPVVAVGEPPIPPATDQHGNRVAVGEPPIPPATDQHGNRVAVGEPPVPPTPQGGAADAPESPSDEP